MRADTHVSRAIARESQAEPAISGGVRQVSVRFALARNELHKSRVGDRARIVEGQCPDRSVRRHARVIRNAPLERFLFRGERHVRVRNG